jgi:hypothetical protein
MRGITGRHFSISERMRVLSSHAWREKGGGFGEGDKRRRKRNAVC